MAHASPVPGTTGTDDVLKLSPTSKASQAATLRAAYIARVVAEAPPLTAEQLDHLAVMLRPVIQQQRANATPVITVADYQNWEVRRHLDSEAPGRHGHFTAEDAA